MHFGRNEKDNMTTIFNDRMGAEHDHRFTEAELDHLLGLAREFSSKAAWTEMDHEAGFVIGYIGQYMLSFSRNEQHGKHVAVLEIDRSQKGQDALPMLSERFNFVDGDDARARAVRLLFLSFGPSLARAMLAGNGHGSTMRFEAREGRPVFSAKSAGEEALDEIATLCGCSEWEYPGQVVRDVRALRDTLMARGARVLQMQRDVNARWGSSKYGPDYDARRDPQRDAHHAFIHITKVVGKLAAELDNVDHAPSVADYGGSARRDVANYLADLLICTLRFAHVWPSDDGAINMDFAVAQRIAAKFPPAPAPDAQRSAVEQSDKAATTPVSEAAAFSREGEGEAASWVEECFGGAAISALSRLAQHTTLRYPLQSFRRHAQEFIERRKEKHAQDKDAAGLQPSIVCPLCAQLREAPLEATNTTQTVAHMLCGVCSNAWYDGTRVEREALFVRALVRLEYEAEAEQNRVRHVSVDAKQAALLTAAGAASARDVITRRLQVKLDELANLPSEDDALDRLRTEIILIAGEDPLSAAAR